MRQGHVEVRVAAGTVFQDILVWRTLVAAVSSPAARADVAPLFRLKGHEGSIHRCLAPL